MTVGYDGPSIEDWPGWRSLNAALEAGFVVTVLPRLTNDGNSALEVYADPPSVLPELDADLPHNARAFLQILLHASYAGRKARREGLEPHKAGSW